MAELFGEWRRAESPCRGGLVLWLRDLVAGAGWGVLDSHGKAKVAYHYLRRVLAPVAVWTTDEGVGGIDIHLANDRSQPLTARLRVSLYRDFAVPVGETSEHVELPARSVSRRGVEEVLGRFVDVSWAHRFGPPGQDVVVVSLEELEGASANPISQCFRFPAGRPARAEPAAALGLEAQSQPAGDGTVSVRVRSRRLAYAVRVRAPGFEPHDDAFSLEPGGERLIRLAPTLEGVDYTGGEVSAANQRGRVRIGLAATESGSELGA
jgi:beta-mannosidase